MREGGVGDGVHEGLGGLGVGVWEGEGVMEPDALQVRVADG